MFVFHLGMRTGCGSDEKNGPRRGKHGKCRGEEPLRSLSLLEKPGGEIAFAGVRQKRHNAFPGKFGTFRELKRGIERGA